MDAVVGDLGEPLAGVAEHEVPGLPVSVVGDIGVVGRDAISIAVRAERISATRASVTDPAERSLRAMFAAICDSRSDSTTWAWTIRVWPYR